MKKILALLLSALLCMQMAACGTTPNQSEDTGKENLQSFYDKVSESQQLLDKVADDIYSYWYDAIYKDKYNEDVSTAVYMAQLANADNIKKIETLDEEIGALFKDVKDSEQSTLVKDVMSAYSDYYEFVVNVSGSFKSYSADKEILKKELASLLRDLSYEL